MLSCTFIAWQARDELSNGCKKMFQNKGSLGAREVMGCSSSESSHPLAQWERGGAVSQLK